MIERNGTKYYPTIGLEIHAELATESKMFCSCKNDPDEDRPNVNTCPVCMAHPGTLPVPNGKAIESVVRVGLAIGADIANFSEFDRKNYFYPDIPKGYQISQYKYPIVAGGEVAGVKITRIHLEEDTANSKHDRGDFSLVDYNRAGVPLMELVTEPVIHDAESVTKFAKELQLLVRTLGVSHANIEKGEMRIEVNVSVSTDPEKLATKVEVKNIGSISAAGRATEFEINRMIDLYEAGKQNEIVQETRGWDENKGITFSQRSKENSNDYRYFPDPDLPKMYLHEMFDLQILKAELPELPWQTRGRLKKDYNWKDENIEIIVNEIAESKISGLEGILNLFLQEALSGLPNEKKYHEAMENYFFNDILSLHKTNIDLDLGDSSKFAEIIKMVVDGEINSRIAKDLLLLVMKDHISPKEYAIQNNLIQKNDPEALKAVAQKIIDANPNVVAEYKAGKESSMMFFVGQIMKETKGSANPQMIQEILKELLK